MLLVATGAVIIPRHLRSANDASIQLENLSITADDELLLANVVDTLIPRTNTPGAKDLNVHLFVLLMLNDCHDQDDQNHFVTGLRQVDQFAVEHTTNSFADCDQSDRVNLLIKMKGKQSTPLELWIFNQLMRRRTIEGYRESKYVMTHLSPHAMIPPPYDGHYPATNYEQTEVTA